MTNVHVQGRVTILGCIASVLEADWRSLCVCVSVLVTIASREKTAEPIEMPFGTDVHGPKEPCLKWWSHCTLAPSGDNNGLVCVAAMMRYVVVITVAT